MSKKGHHGGAWKVAYADFVTAMMALFLVLWLTAQDEKIKEAVERAFRNPFSSVIKESVGIIPNKDVQAVSKDDGNFDSASAIELAMLRRLNQDLVRLLKSELDETNSSVQLDMTPEGLRINIFDRSQKPIFEEQSTIFTTYGEWVITTLAWEVARYDRFSIEIEGHTETGHPPLKNTYGSWELSADRANASRRKILQHGVRSEQIRKVAGFADTQPMPETEPEDEVNRRVTLLLKINSDNKPHPLTNHAS